MIRFASQIVGVCANVSAILGPGPGTGSVTGVGVGNNLASWGRLGLMGGLLGGGGIGVGGYNSGGGREGLRRGSSQESESSVTSGGVGGGMGISHNQQSLTMMTEQVVFVCTSGADQLNVLKMVPLARQVGSNAS